VTAYKKFKRTITLKEPEHTSYTNSMRAKNGAPKLTLTLRLKFKLTRNCGTLAS